MRQRRTGWAGRNWVVNIVSLCPMVLLILIALTSSVVAASTDLAAVMKDGARYPAPVTTTHRPDQLQRDAEGRQVRFGLEQLSAQDDPPSSQKDFWDKLESSSTLIGGVLVAMIGGVATYFFNRRQREAEDARTHHELAIQRVQTLKVFLPELRSTHERDREAALLAMSSLGDPDLASRLAELYRGEGAIMAMAKIASRASGEESIIAQRSLDHILQRLREAVVLVQGSLGSVSGFVSGPDQVASVDYVAGGPADPASSTRNETFPIRFQDGRETSGTIVFHLPDAHLMLLSVDTSGVRPLPIEEDESALRSTEEVLVLGYKGTPQGYVQVGKVTGWRDSHTELGGPLLVADLETPLGFAGAPVVNTAGLVVGVCRAAQGGVAFLIPGTSVARLLTLSVNN